MSVTAPTYRTTPSIRIAFVGPKESGKTTGAGILMEIYQYLFNANAVTLSFAEPLKELASRVTPDGEILKPRDRGLLQFLGTDYYRRKISDTWWTDKMVERVNLLGPTNPMIVVDDCRFANEAECLRQLGFLLLYLVPPEVSQDPHASETELQNISCDYYMVNPKQDLVQYRIDLVKALTHLYSGVF